jgi:predicted PurR-regulated permease PerM
MSNIEGRCRPCSPYRTIFQRFKTRRRGADLPLPLILAGIIGGLVAFGVIGIFIGPTVLGMSYTLLDPWIAEGEETS